MNSFQIEQEILINAPAAKVFQRLVGDVAPWWDHGFSESPKAIVLEPKVGGRFYEEFGGAEGDGALYCTVMQVETGKKLVLQGPMGMRGAVFGNIAFELVEKGGATTLKLSHHAIGEVTEEHKKNYTSGWRELLGTRLKNLVETGKA
jgi:uncharacterized protein YndB with AHSA1/START domain